jgi:hypothetical protein
LPHKKKRKAATSLEHLDFVPILASKHSGTWLSGKIADFPFPFPFAQASGLTATDAARDQLTSPVWPVGPIRFWCFVRHVNQATLFKHQPTRIDLKFSKAQCCGTWIHHILAMPAHLWYSVLASYIFEKGIVSHIKKIQHVLQKEWAA